MTVLTKTRDGDSDFWVFINYVGGRGVKTKEGICLFKLKFRPPLSANANHQLDVGMKT